MIISIKSSGYIPAPYNPYIPPVEEIYPTSAIIEPLIVDQIDITFSSYISPAYIPSSASFEVSNASDGIIPTEVIDVSLTGLNVITLTVNNDYEYMDEVYVNYTKPAINYLRSLDESINVTTFEIEVTNSIIAPAYLFYARIYPSKLNEIELTFSNELDYNFIPDLSAFDVSGNTVIDIEEGTSQDLVLVLDSSYSYGIDYVTVSYTKPDNNFLRSTKDAIVKSFSNVEVDYYS